jgi:membrane protease YdiL (CAAX protease family)
VNADTSPPPRSPRLALLALAALLLGGAAAALFPRAFPTLSPRIALTREEAIARSRELARAHGLAPAGSRAAARFDRDEALMTWVELGAGGKDTLAALVRGRDVALFAWRVRLFAPGSPREARIVWAADGRLVGVERTLPDSARRPALPAAAARALADSVLVRWGARDPARWRLAAASERTVPQSGRLDRSYTYERTDRTVGGAPIRAEVRIAGDLPAAVREEVEVPERFERRYGEMRSANDFLALLAQLAVPILGIMGAWALVRLGRRRAVRWRPAIAAGAVMGALYAAIVLNELPSSWFDYRTETAPATWIAQWLVGAVAAGAAMGLTTALLVAMAESLERAAFPRHVDWWRAWRARGTREVATLVAGGYALAAFGFAYTAAFYLVTREAFGWWVPSDVLDDPNQIATTLPWLAAIAESLRAAVQEEALFRAVPLGFLAWRFRASPRRGAILAAGVVGSALVFAFGHANYPSWPPYSRGVELLLESVLWGIVFIRWGILPTVIAHFVYDLVWFGLFALGGSDIAYRVTFGVVALALLLPALAVAWRAARARGLTTLGVEGTFGAWAPAARAEREPHAPLALARPLSAGARVAALLVAAAGAASLLLLGRGGTVGPPFTVGRERAVAIADSVMRARGADPRAWRALAATEARADARLARFLAAHDADSLRAPLAAHDPPAAWLVRHVRTGGAAQARAEEWRTRIAPDGRVVEVAHHVPEDAPAPDAPPEAVRTAARAAAAASGLDPSRLAERELRTIPRPRRRDARVVLADTSLALPAGAEARVAVTVVGGTAERVERGVHLPDVFERADRARIDDLLVVGSVALAALLLVLGAAALALMRRDPLDEPQAPRRALAAGLAAVAAVELARAADLFPARLAEWDTATPWTTWLATLALATAAAALLAMVVGGLWYAADEARRRIGIPAVPGRGSARDVLLAGAALGLLPTALAGAAALLGARDPALPTTVLDRLTPLASRTLDAAHGALLALPIVAGAGAVLAEAARTRGRLALLVAVLGAALAPWLVLAEPRLDLGGAAAAGVALALVGAGAAALWGRLSASAWVVGALVAAGGGAAARALAAGTAVDAWSAWLAAAAMAALAAWVARLGVGAPSPAPSAEAPAPR